MATTSNMFLYSLTVQPPTNVTQAVLGQFAGTREQLIITAAGSQLSLLRPDPSQGKVITLLSHDVFGIIRSLAAFRLAGSNKGKSIQTPFSGKSLSDIRKRCYRRVDRSATENSMSCC
jgi:splicing factor 3B subunit 3